MKVTVTVMPKKGLLDPQGAAVRHALEHLGLAGVGDVRVGKVITLEFAGAPTDASAEDGAFRERMDAICRDLLSNPVIEDFRWEVAGA